MSKKKEAPNLTRFHLLSELPTSKSRSVTFHCTDSRWFIHYLVTFIVRVNAIVPTSAVVCQNSQSKLNSAWTDLQYKNGCRGRK